MRYLESGPGTETITAPGGGTNPIAGAFAGAAGGFCLSIFGRVGPDAAHGRANPIVIAMEATRFMVSPEKQAVEPAGRRASRPSATQPK